MSTVKQLIPHDQALLVTGSLNAMEDDRGHDDRSLIHPVQIVLDGDVINCSCFDSLGELGVSALVVVQKDPLVTYITTGADLIELSIENDGSAQVRRIEIPALKDVHEMSLLDGVLWLANTGYDEAVAIDLDEKCVVKRIVLGKFRGKIRASLPSFTGNDIQAVDRYHCNQVFQDINGKLCALVHHTSGKQLLKRIARKVIKSQGDGGVVDLDTGQAVSLSLKGPHSVRCVNGDYWVCDSGSRMLNVYDATWRLKNRLPTHGWGRGADFSKHHGLYYVGISAERKRYRDRPDYNDRNLIEVFKTDDGELLGEIPIVDGIEQINNVYLLQRGVVETLLGLKLSSWV
ncbi:uncharacterized protein DUF4915 [Thiogranum longum]|uniref:Uncharacterized protein DUF4915 n=1 Tax=Thiogranum longum TaxID=1537524 RepID=A0A4R1HC91_9GAMM|nr:DUF4915 domain-containing protein [Thiogranum longum]TCK18163.1 uncharacterized protein DUF4915 [Thiogranum longum]